MDILCYLIIYILIGISITYALTTGWILKGPKDRLVGILAAPFDLYLSKLLYCPQCLGFWIGAGMPLVMEPLWYKGPYMIQLLLSGFLISTASSVFARLMGEYT